MNQRPQYQIMVEQADEKTMVLCMVVSTETTMSKTFLCTQDQNYQQIAKEIHDGICKAGAEARRLLSGIVVVKDLPDGLKNGSGNARSVRG